MNDRWGRRLGFAALIAWAGVALSGCGSSLSTVSGNVTLDGKPLEKGAISYVPANAKDSPATAEISGGKYELQVMAGKNAVQISAPVVVGKRKEYEGPDAPLVEITEESVPPKYNSETTLSFDVQPGKNSKDWAIESQRRP
jgi:hypothetical protein